MSESNGRKVSIDWTISLNEVIRIIGLLVTLIYLAGHFAESITERVMETIAAKEATAGIVHAEYERRITTLEGEMGKIRDDLSKVREDVSAIRIIVEQIKR